MYWGELNSLAQWGVGGCYTTPTRTSALSRHLTTGLSWHADPEFDLVAPRRSQLLQLQMLFPAGELQTTLTKDIAVHTMQRMNEMREEERERVESLRAASYSKKKERMNVYNFSFGSLFCCFHVVQHTFFFLSFFHCTPSLQWRQHPLFLTTVHTPTIHNCLST